MSEIDANHPEALPFRVLGAVLVPLLPVQVWAMLTAQSTVVYATAAAGPVGLVGCVGWAVVRARRMGGQA